MKKSFLAIMAVIFVAFTACNDSKNFEKAETFQHQIDTASLKQFHDRWNGGSINGPQVVIACENHFEYNPSDLHWEGEYNSFCVYQMQNVTPQTAGDLNGCYNVVNSELISEADGSRPGITVTHLYDTIYSARVTYPSNVRADFAPYLEPCHADIYRVCIDTVAHRIIAYYKDHHNQEGSVEGDWWGGRVRDTAWMTVRDTLIIHEHDTVHHYVVDTLVTNGDTTVFTYFILRSHKSWDGVLSGGYLYGTDSVRLIKMNASGVIVDTWRDTYRHRTPVTYNVPATMPVAVEGNCYTFNGSSANCAGTTASCNLGNTQVVGPVIIGGMDITNYLQGCHPFAQKICFGSLTNGNGSWTIFILGPEGDTAATITGTYHAQQQRTLDSVAVHVHHNGVNSIDVCSSISMYSQCNNSTDSVFYWSDGASTMNTTNWSKRFNRSVSFNGVFTVAHVGRRVPISAAGVADFGDGFSVSFGPATPSYPQGHAAEGAMLNCTHHFVWAEATASGVVEHGYIVCALTGHSDSVSGTFYLTPADTLPTPPTPPDTTIDMEGHLDWIYISDTYTGNGSGLSTWIVGMWTLSDGSHFQRWAPIHSCGTSAAWTSESVTAARYTYLASQILDTNFALAHINTVGTPSGAGYLLHNSDHTIGDYWWTTADGIARVHCNIGGYANGWNGHNPIHYRNVTGGTVHVNETVHGTHVNHIFQ